MTLGLRGHFLREARAAQRRAAERLRAGRGFDGQALLPKRDGTPFSETLPRLLEAEPPEATERGFAIRYDDPRLLAFDLGGDHSPPRRVIGLAQAEADGITKRTADEVARQLGRLLRRA